MSSKILEPLTHKLAALDIKQTARTLLVSIDAQRLTLISPSDTTVFVISTSKSPPSCIEDSYGTPDGLHRIAEKHGDAAPLGTVFRGRRSIGKTYDALPPEEQAPNLVTTRILWLEGLEPGHNQGGNRDSYRRYIYIHGTNHEDKLGTPASGGCIQLSNTDVVTLFDAVSVGDLVYIA